MHLHLHVHVRESELPADLRKVAEHVVDGDYLVEPQLEISREVSMHFTAGSAGTAVSTTRGA